MGLLSECDIGPEARGRLPPINLPLSGLGFRLWEGIDLYPLSQSQLSTSGFPLGSSHILLPITTAHRSSHLLASAHLFSPPICFQKGKKCAKSFFKSSGQGFVSYPQRLLYSWQKPTWQGLSVCVCMCAYPCEHMLFNPSGSFRSKSLWFYKLIKTWLRILNLLKFT